MPLNIEVKVKVRDSQRQQALAATLATSPPEKLNQTDTFFCVPDGRLKLRQFTEQRGELIFYQRPDLSGPKTCTYSISRTDEPAVLQAMLAAALGVVGEVRKQRTLYLAGQARIHFDQVEGLGTFLELEVVLRPGQSQKDGQGIADRLMGQLDIHQEDLVAGAYLDLLLKKNPT